MTDFFFFFFQSIPSTEENYILSSFTLLIKYFHLICPSRIPGLPAVWSGSTKQQCSRKDYFSWSGGEGK